MNILKHCLYLIKRIDPDATYQIQYIDYPDYEWTVPVKLTDERIEKMSTDNSVASVK